MGPRGGFVLLQPSSTGADGCKEEHARAAGRAAGRGTLQYCGPGAPPFCLLAPLVFLFLSVSDKRLPITQTVFMK